MRHRFTVEIEDDAWVSEAGDEAATSRPMLTSMEVTDGDPSVFFELISPLGDWVPDQTTQAEGPPGPYALDAVIGRLRHGGEGFQTLVEFVVRQPDGTAGLWSNGGSWREPMETPSLEPAVEAEVDQFWSDADTQELEMRADPDPPPVFWYGVDATSRAALAGDSR